MSKFIATTFVAATLALAAGAIIESAEAFPGRSGPGGIARAPGGGLGGIASRPGGLGLGNVGNRGPGPIISRPPTGLPSYPTKPPVIDRSRVGDLKKFPGGGVGGLACKVNPSGCKTGGGGSGGSGGSGGGKGGGHGGRWFWGGITILAADYSGCGYEYYKWRSTGATYWKYRYYECVG